MGTVSNELGTLQDLMFPESGPLPRRLREILDTPLVSTGRGNTGHEAHAHTCSIPPLITIVIALIIIFPLFVLHHAARQLVPPPSIHGSSTI